MRILVTFAVPTEFAPWKRKHKFSRMPGLPTGLDLKPCPMVRAQIGKAEVVVALTGMGPVRARRAARYALQCGPEICISSGLAGAVKDEFKRGDILVARQVAEMRGKRAFACDMALVEQAGTSGACVVERFLTSPSVVLSSKAKRSLAALGDAVEMESLGVLAAAHAANTPAVAIRVISDDAGQDLPVDFNHVLSGKGKVRPVRLLSSLAAEPGSLRGLLQLAGDSKRASAGLADFLDSYIESVANGAGSPRAAMSAAGRA